jgi:hypothetical protein
LLTESPRLVVGLVALVVDRRLLRHKQATGLALMRPSVSNFA